MKKRLIILKILVIHGPNLNLLGIREPETYGNATLDTINSLLMRIGKELGLKVECYQSNHEGEIVETIQQSLGKYDGIIINPAAFTHYSIAIRDALLAVNIPTVEVHISNIYKREEFRHKSVISDICKGVISGLGIQGYELALRWFDFKK